MPILKDGSAFKGPLRNRDSAYPENRRWHRDLPIQIQPETANYWNDFLSNQEYAAADWTITLAGAGGTIALVSGARNGAIRMTPDTTDDNSVSAQLIGGTWGCAADKNLWFRAKVTASAATDSDFFVGLAPTDTTPLDADNRMGFRVTDGSASIVCESRDASNTQSTVSGTLAVSATAIDLAMHWNGANIEFFINDSLVATHATSFPASTAALRPTLYIQNGSAGAKTLDVDYLIVSQER